MTIRASANPFSPRGTDLVDRACRLAGCETTDDGTAAGFERWLVEAGPKIDTAVREAVGAVGSPRLTQLLELWADVVDERTGRRADLLTNMQSALSQVRTVTDIDTLYDRGVRLICDVLGFDRASISRVDGSVWWIERAYFPADPALGDQFLLVAAADPPRLTHELAESEIVRRRAPILVTDAGDDPRTHKAFIAASDVKSYVAAPILPAGEVIGFMHADRYDSGQQVDELDRDMLSAFAEAFGYAVERTMLLERQRQLRREVRQLVRTTEAMVGGFTDEGSDPVQPRRPDAAATRSSTLRKRLDPAPADPRIEGVLTRRELEVLALMAEGRTNAGIAERLVISETTVKSHVRNVLRKLGATNRSTAIARYLRVQDDS